MEITFNDRKYPIPANMVVDPLFRIRGFNYVAVKSKSSLGEESFEKADDVIVFDNLAGANLVLIFCLFLLNVFSAKLCFCKGAIGNR